ncbi:metallophosphoesterase [Chryseobacterium arthrosphaerae]|uniref:Metallophosphatase n=1 Tax=Chryseobacterium arthrosphaerae TaxID=651561 RepID=A0A1B8ZI45_9FLAO|nr:metallophosphoesterase [Chryseobacterium arthrosphaerae]OCA71206.1 metallophosphatase [Chryseobacterium arthrosphaerae]
MSRTLVIGDIHGGLRALKQVFERAAVTREDKLIFLGDFVDGWSESSQAIRFLIEVSGNQECTVESYTDYSREELEIHLEFFQRMKNYYVDKDNRLFIHAGYSSMHGPEKEVYSSNYHWDRTLWETAVAMDRKLKTSSELYPKRLLLYNEIFIGHTPTLYLGIRTPVNKANIWNMDTGAAFTGALSLMDINTKEYWQSDPLPLLYPDEKGRNNDKAKPKNRL